MVVNAARPAEINGDVLTLEFGDQLFVDRFKEKSASGKAVFEELREAIIGAVGMRFRFIPIDPQHRTEAARVAQTHHLPTFKINIKVVMLSGRLIFGKQTNICKQSKKR